MLICHCRAITDTAIEAHIEAGVYEEADLVQRCGAGRRCGACLPVIRELLTERGVPCPLRADDAGGKARAIEYHRGTPSRERLLA